MQFSTDMQSQKKLNESFKRITMRTNAVLLNDGECLIINYLSHSVKNTYLFFFHYFLNHKKHMFVLLLVMYNIIKNVFFFVVFLYNCYHGSVLKFTHKKMEVSYID